MGIRRLASIEGWDARQWGGCCKSAQQPLGAGAVATLTCVQGVAWVHEWFL